ncbi:energy transducer TonB [Sphingosinithalassobacter portus]|uniref:energy transducer TonB n=1 Tax=Stakelama portus TaxID=2676234 RepID=UPI000D6E407D|nr:energy transducer TonB [Sphingosinithalassobacter portus]
MARSGSIILGLAGLAATALLAPPAFAQDHASATRQTVVRLTTDRSGRPRQCDVIETSGSAQLDATTCDLMMQRMRFRPVRDAQGVRVEQVIVRTVDWTQDSPK